MAFWDKFKKKKPDIPPERDFPTLAGIPAPDIDPIHNNSFKTEGSLSGPNSDAENALISPPPYQPGLGGWIQTYPLVFFLMVNNVCVKKIDYVCSGDDKPDRILSKMKQEGLLPDQYGIHYRILYWPTANGMSTVDQVDYSEPKMLMDFNPEPGKVFIIEQYRKVEAPEPMYTLYGCPTAAMPEQESQLKNRSVDVISWE